MSLLLFRCLLFCSGVLTLNAALALPLIDTLFTSSSYETKQASLTKEVIAESKAEHQAIIFKNYHTAEFKKDNVYKLQLKVIFSTIISVLKINQTAISMHVEYLFRRNVLPSFNHLLEYLPSTLIK